MAIDAETRRPVLGNVQGGLSGPGDQADRAAEGAARCTKSRGRANIPIIGQGGIVIATDAIEFLIAGATAVGVGTALFYDPLVCRKINAGLASHLARHALASPRALTGALQLAGAAPPRC